MIGQNLGKREKSLLTICVILGVSALGYSLALEPSARHWKMLNKKVEATSDELSKDMRLVNMYDRIEAEYARYTGYITAGRGEEEELAAVLAEIENVSKRTSCLISNVKPRSPGSIGGYREISFMVTAEGSAENLSAFLHAIETSKELLRVAGFTITPKSRQADLLKGAFVINKVLITK